MSDTVFGCGYADQYDLLYSDKDYEAECDLLEEVFRRYGTGPVQTILDLGCGTGSHALLLARRGYQVTGVDRSQEMLAQARQKAASDASGSGYIPPTFHQSDVCTPKFCTKWVEASGQAAGQRTRHRKPAETNRN